ncbi:MAG: DNA-3-methyladenine glycosylase [Candidatus Neomarinimicrobiota bacterium]|nr:DNA-3-methyladenine glycosylase [Candidatus Neomarinimicrobiota bacterium]
MPKLNKEFYERSNVLLISRELLGKVLCTNYNGKLTSGIIVETEAYAGVIDKASHAYNNKKTNRTKIMYDSGGVAYIYLCYGIHHLFNVITNSKNIPHAILIRAIEPINGIETMLTRRNKKNKDYTLTSGPGSLTKALGITINDSGKSLMSNLIWIENQKNINENNVISSPRVGIQYAKDDISNPWRYRIKNNPWTSPAK